jgi:NADPH:quinone reductase
MPKQHLIKIVTVSQGTVNESLAHPREIFKPVITHSAYSFVIVHNLWGADAVIVSTEGPIDEQVRRIVGPQGIKYAIDPVVGETGIQIYQALGEGGRMLVYGSLTGEPIRVGADPRFILAGRRILEVFWLGYWFARLDETARNNLVQEVVTLLRHGVLATSTVACAFSLDEIGEAVTQAESIGRQGKVLLVPERQ